MEYYWKYRNLKVRLAKYRLKSDAETIKTVATIDALLDRAYDIHFGVVAGGKILGNPPGIDEVNLTARATNYLEALERGEKPLLGKFTEPGISLSDHCFVKEGDTLHLFYNRGFIGYDWPERCVDTIGHAVTKDLKNWQICTPAVSVRSGEADCYSVWSPTVAKKDGKYFMLYTGVNENIAQATCLATSDDLFTWTPYDGNPVYVPGAWTPWDKSKWSDNRDVHVLEEDGVYYMYYCTTRYLEDGSTHNAMGIAKSQDLINWEHCDACLLEGCNHMPESPYVIKRKGKYYMFYTNCGVGTCYAVSDNPVSGWFVVGELLTEGRFDSGDSSHVPSCAEVFEFKGQWYISYCTRIPGNEQYLELKELFWNEDGSITIGEDVK